jgi:hypothetical protein
MALLALFLFFLTPSLMSSAELTPVSAPDLDSPLSEHWQVRHGLWEVKSGVMTASELLENKHAAVLWCLSAMQSGAVECEVQFSGAKTFILGCDGDRHIGRVVIQPKLLRLIDDSTEVKGKSPGTELASAGLDIQPEQWVKLRYEWDGQRMAAEFGGGKVEATHENLGKAKTRWWMAVGGASVKIRNLKVFGGS